MGFLTAFSVGIELFCKPVVRAIQLLVQIFPEHGSGCRSRRVKG